MEEAARDRQTQTTLNTIAEFNDACNRGDIDAMMAVSAEDVIFENTWPPPDGARTEGREAFRAFWVGFFRESKNPRFEAEDVFAAGDRCVIRWVYHWGAEDGGSGHVRGVDVFRVTDGRISEKLSYVKG